MTEAPSAASFRDPSGFIFFREGKPFRQINRRYKEAFRHLIQSGLYEELVREQLLIPHVVVEEYPEGSRDPLAVIAPEEIPFISYPYEWCFEQLQEAALVTLRIQLKAMERGMTLKDATAFNIQFLEARAIHIDTLSFDIYRDGQPWMAYNQFCKHFLAPLVLMATRDLRLGRMSAQFLDGIPLDIASSLLPTRTRFHPLLLAHIHAHGKMAAKDSNNERSRESMGTVKKSGLVLMLQSLERYIASLKPKGSSLWARYYDECTYTEGDLGQKTALVNSFLDQIGDVATLWDLGANTGHLSRLATSRGIRTLALDYDPWAVSRCYADAKRRGDKLMLPLVQDLTNPTPALGVRNKERDSLIDRANADVVMGLALVHHLTIGANVPFPLVARLFADIGRYAIVEFVPATDPQSQRLMRFREEVFDTYSQDSFEHAFKELFDVLRSEPVGESGRVLYLMARR
jgi:hypothetical protein